MKRVMMIVALLAGSAIGQTTQPATAPSTQPTTRPADEAMVDQLTSDLETAKSGVANEAARVLDALHATEGFKKAALDASSTEAAVKDARVRALPSLSDLSAKWIAAKAKVAQMERAALAADRWYVNAIAERARLDKLLKEAIHAVEERQVAENRAKSAKEWERRQAREELRKAQIQHDRNPTDDQQNIVTLKAFYQVKPGQTYNDALEIIGEHGKIISDVVIGGSRTVMVQWVNRDGSNMNVMIQDGTIVSRAQFGLR